MNLIIFQPIHKTTPTHEEALGHKNNITIARQTHSEPRSGLEATKSVSERALAPTLPTCSMGSSRGARVRSTLTLTYVGLSLAGQTLLFRSTGCIASPARGKEGLVTIARFPCSLEVFAQSQWGASCHMTSRLLTARTIKHTRPLALSCFGHFLLAASNWPSL